MEKQDNTINEGKGSLEIDDDYEWECSGKKIDKFGNVVDRYEKKEIILELDNQDTENEKSWRCNKPFAGEIVGPTVEKVNKSLPDKGLQMEYVFGYRASDTRNNVFYLPDNNKIVFMTAAVAIILDKTTNTQQILGGGEKSALKGHDDDIISLAMDSKKEILATGQVGKTPYICIWSLKDGSLLKKLYQEKDSRAVRSISISNSGQYLVSAGDDNSHTLFLFDLNSGKLLSKAPGGTDPILDIEFCPSDETLFATVGKRGAAFWRINSGKLSCNKGIFGSHKMADMYCAEWLSNGNCITGSINGCVYVWKGSQCIKTVKLHEGWVSSISAIPGGVVTGGKDSYVVVLTEDFKEIKRVKVSANPKAIDQDGEGNIIVGLRDGSIVEITKDSKCNTLMTSHSDGEAWGLAICPNTGLILTTGDDNKILAYDPSTNKCVRSGIINEKAGPKPKSLGASTLSKFPPNQSARALAINPKNGNVAMGINTGELSVRKSIEQLDQEIVHIHDAKEWIEAIQYSPCGKYLAVGSHDNCIYIYDESYKLKAKCNKHSSFITSVDWSLDSAYIQATCGAYEILFFDAMSGKQLSDGAESLRDEKWATWTSRIGWSVQGIYPSGVDGSHINGVDRSHSHELIATGDDWRLLNLMRYPCLKGGKGYAYVGHSEHVVRVKFDNKDEYLYSIGGYDKTMIKWRIIDL